MALTRDFKDTVKARAERDPEFRVALLEEALAAFLNADLETGKVLLCDYVNATVGYEQLGAQLHKSPKSLMRTRTRGRCVSSTIRLTSSV